MDLRFWKNKEEKTAEADAAGDINLPANECPATRPPETGPRPKGGRSKLYTVRVRETFKGEILTIQARLQLERQSGGRKARKVTEGELMEMMLEAFKIMRRNGELKGHAVPIPEDVWCGLQEIARRLQMAPADAFEQLVVGKFAELGLADSKS